MRNIGMQKKEQQKDWAMWACVNNKKSCVGPVHCTLPELCMSHQVIGHICLPLYMGLQGKEEVRSVEAAPPALTCNTVAVCIWDDRGLGLVIWQFLPFENMHLALFFLLLSINNALLLLPLWALWQLVPDDMMPQKTLPFWHCKQQQEQHSLCRPLLRPPS